MGIATEDDMTAQDIKEFTATIHDHTPYNNLS